MSKKMKIIIAVLVFAFGAFFIDVYYNWPAFIIEEPAIEITETTDNLPLSKMTAKASA